MRIQYFSDLHLEFLKTTISFKSVAPILVLAGDIGYPHENSYKNFIKSVSEQFEKVFLIAGNHEYYRNLQTIEETNKKIHDLITSSKLSNVTFLNNSFEDYAGYRFVGSTLWTEISNLNYLSNDFNEIVCMSVEKYNQLHHQSRQFLSEIIHTDKKIIVISHHVPSHILTHPDYVKFEKYKQCFSSNSDDLIKENIVCWFYGHTHKPMSTKLNGVQMCCNPIGYPDENKKIDFEKIIEI